MTTLLSLLAAVALLVWGTYIVRTGFLRVYGASFRRALAVSGRSRFAALAAGIGVTTLLQSSTATTLIAASFVGQGLLATATALVVVLGADIGTCLVALVLSLDLSWLSPLCILAGVALLQGYLSDLPRRFFRGDPKFRDEYTLIFTDAGIDFKTENMSAKIAWSFYTGVIDA